MLLSALRDIWEAFREYVMQALQFGMTGTVLYSLYFIVSNIIKKYRKKEYRSFWQVFFRICIFAVFIIYLSYLISLTLSGREAGSRSGHINLVPLSTLFFNGSIGMTAIENILLFIPFGLLVPILWKFFRHWWNLVLMGFITSMMIELTQLLTQRGYFELDDILFNTAGAWLGYFVFFLFFYSLNAVKKRAGKEIAVGNIRREKRSFLEEAAVVGIQLIPILIMLAVIFGFSSESGEESGALSKAVTGKIVAAADRLLSLDLSIEERKQATEHFEIVIRKCAHMTEYALLAFCIAAFLYCRRLKRRTVFFMTELFAVFTAAMDEWYQTSISGRSGVITDILIDALGALLMLILLLVVLRIYTRRNPYETKFHI